jgi:1,4-dihydroxy-2-naphthoate octaprenyltransferase
VTPVVVGASSVRPASINIITTLLCGVVALGLQIGTNYANDYSDGVRGTDEVRVGPFRLTASGLVPARDVRTAALASFALAGAAGLILCALTSWWLVLVGMTAVAAGWFYTGGPRPYGYLGLGEAFVFVYFGLVATVGTSYVQHGHVPGRAWWFAAALGAAACALLEANNLRDIDGDRVAGKRTLAVRLGRPRGAWLYGVFAATCVVAGSIGAGAATWWSIPFAVAIAGFYAPAVRMAYSPREGRELLKLLAASARAQLLLGVVLTAGAWTIH